MAELEMSKHLKKGIMALVNKNNNGFSNKLKDFFIEILIIVFAVSLSIWFHELSTKIHQKNEVRDFLIDLRSDLQNDKKNFEKEKSILLESDYEYKFKNQDTIALNKTKIDKTSNKFTLLRISRKNNKGNFEAFKSSGNISSIHNKLLKRMIFNYYEQNLKELENNESDFNKLGDKILDYILQNNKENKSFIYSNSVLYKNYQGRIIKKYDEILIEIGLLLAEINDELKE